MSCQVATMPPSLLSPPPQANEVPELRDEVFVQLCKQLAGNPSVGSAERGWVLLHCALCSFPPSEELENFLEVRRAGSGGAGQGASLPGPCQHCSLPPPLQLWLRDHGAVACVWAMHLSLYRAGPGPAGCLGPQDLALALERARVPALPPLSADVALVLQDAPPPPLPSSSQQQQQQQPGGAGAGAAADSASTAALFGSPLDAPPPPPPPPLFPAAPSNAAPPAASLDVRPPPPRPQATGSGAPPRPNVGGGPAPLAPAADPAAQFGASLAALGDDLEARLEAIAQSLRNASL